MARTSVRFDRMEVELGDNSGLTNRQSEIAHLVGRGFSARDIANDLGVSERTVQGHIDALKDRFHAHNRIDLLCQMWMHGILQAKQSVRATALVLALFAAFPMARTVRPTPQQRTVASTMRVGRSEIAAIFGGAA